MIRRLVLILVIIVSVLQVRGQVMGDHTQRFFIDFNLIPGKSDQTYTAIPLTSNFKNVVNATEGPLKYTKGESLTYDMQFGFYLTKRKNIALSVGFMYLIQQGNLSVDTFHVEYQSTDYKGNTFRQSVSSVNGIKESAQISNMSIPILLKYKVELSKKFFCTIDAGVLYNIESQNNYKSNAHFDYEAIYQFGGTGTNLTYSYDNGVSPDGQDWLITKKEFLKDNPTGNIQDYFNSLKKIGYNVGLNQSIASRTGTINYDRSSLGYMVLPALNYRLTTNTILRIGFSYFSQIFVNPERQNKLLFTNNVGDYSSLMNYTTNVKSTNYGVSFGLSFYFNTYIQKQYDHYFNVKLHQ